MRDWILEMRGHTDAVRGAIDGGQMDEAWRLAHVFQAWCIERIDSEHYSQRDAGTLLSAPQQFLVRILKGEGKIRESLIHLIFQGVLDARNLKYYPKEIKSCFRKCGFSKTVVEAALELYEAQKVKQQPWDETYIEIKNAVSSWR